MKSVRPPVVKFKDGVVSIRVNGVDYKFKNGEPYLDTALRPYTEDYAKALEALEEWEYEHGD